MLNTSSNIGSNKSFVYDLNKERGIVRTRVALCHDLLRLSLSSGDLFINSSLLPGSRNWGLCVWPIAATHRQPSPAHRAECWPPLVAS